MSIETQLLSARICQSEAGEVVGYRELSEIIGQDVQQEGRAALHYARHIALRDHQIVTDAVRGIGIKRLTDSEAVQSGAALFARVRRQARRGVDRLTAVDYDALAPADKALHNASLSALAVVKLMATPKSLARITANTAGSGELPIARTLELFRGPKRSD